MKSPAVGFIPWIQTGTVFLSSLLLMGAQIKGGELVLQEAVSYRAEGRRYQQVGDLHSAAACYQRAIVANPSYSDVYNDLGIVLESLGNLPDAEKAYKTALRLNSRLGGADSNLALLYEKMGRMDEAAAHWTARVKSGPPNDPWVNKARGKLGSYHFPVPESPEEAARKRKAEEGRQARTRQIQAQRPAPEEAPPRASAQRPAPEEAPPRASAQRPALTDAKALAQQLAGEKAKTAKQKTDEERRRREQAETARKRQEAEQKAEKSRLQKEQARAAREKQAAERMSQKVPPKPKAASQALLNEAARIAKELAKAKAKVASLPPPAPPAPESKRLAEKLTREKQESRRRSVGELIQRGIASMRQGRYAEAVVHYQQALILDPESAEADQGLKRAQAALAKSK